MSEADITIVLSDDHPMVRDLDALAACESDNFVLLTQAARLNPARAFIGADLTGVDLRNCKLAGFNFRGAILREALYDATTDWTGADLTGTRFDSGRHPLEA